MATKALTRVAQRASSDFVRRLRPRAHERDLRQLLILSELDDVWAEIASFIEPRLDKTVSNLDAVTQELFIRLLTEGRFDLYLEQNYTDEAIRLDVLSTLDHIEEG